MAQQCKYFNLLTVDSLSCSKQYRTLFEGLSFSLEPGSIVQLEGPNGAGKTSLLRILAGFARADAGTVLFQQQPINEQLELYHAQLLYLGHKPALNGQLTARENMQFFQQTHPCLHGDDYQLLAQLGLVGLEDVPVRTLSAGQQRRVALTRLWRSTAPLWLLDEPFTAVDKAGVVLLQQRFAEHIAQGGCILLTTHQDLTAHFAELRSLRLTA